MVQHCLHGISLSFFLSSSSLSLSLSSSFLSASTVSSLATIPPPPPLLLLQQAIGEVEPVAVLEVVRCRASWFPLRC